MTRSHRLPAFNICLLVAFLFASVGCAPTQPQSFKTSFLPPAPQAIGVSEPEVEFSTPPQNPNYFVKEVPNLIPASVLAPRYAEIESRLRRAEERFEAGRTFYQEGKIEEARREFNKSVDILLTTPENAPERYRVERRLEQMVETIFRYDVNGMEAGEDSDKVVYDKSPKDGILEMTFPLDPQLKPKVREEVQATVSQLPLEENDSVLSYIHFFSTDRGRKILAAGLRRAGRYRPMIQRVLQEEGVPQELIYLAQIESSFLPRAASNMKCVGMWQFAAFRGREYGLNQTPYTDDRMDPELATRAAAKHLRDLFNQFGDWYLAMSAYNCGPGCVDRAVQRTGYADFWKLRDLRALPRETQNYVPVILAITIMAKNAKDYGLENIDPDQPVVYDAMKLEAATNLALVADAIERPVSELRELNPALLRGIAPEGYELRVPKGSAPALAAALNAIPAARRASWRMHRVERGETMALIAKRYGTASAAITAANGRLMAFPEAGDVLIIPSAYQDTAPAVKRPSAKAKSRSSARPSTRRASVKSSPRKAPTPQVRTAAVARSRASIAR